VTPAATINITDETPVITEVENYYADGETHYCFDGAELQTKSNENVVTIFFSVVWFLQHQEIYG
jgi:hypothetical protein